MVTFFFLSSFFFLSISLLLLSPFFYYPFFLNRRLTDLLMYPHTWLIPPSLSSPFSSFIVVFHIRRVRTHYTCNSLLQHELKNLHVPITLPYIDLSWLCIFLHIFFFVQGLCIPRICALHFRVFTDIEKLQIVLQELVASSIILQIQLTR